MIDRTSPAASTVNYENRYREAVRVIQQIEWTADKLRWLLKQEGTLDVVTALRDAQRIIVDCAAFLDCHGEGHLT